MIGKDCTIGAFVEIGKGVEIGNRCRIGAMTYIPENVRICDDVFIGPGVTFTNDKHPPSRGRWRNTRPTVVMDNAVIGAGAVILPSLTIGEGAVVGAGAVVTKNVKGWTTVKGNPAK